VTEEMPVDKKLVLINRILEIELQWFLTVNPEPATGCQQHPQAFKVMRGSAFESWSEETLSLYLEHIAGAQNKGINLMREKYAKIQGLMPCENYGKALQDITEIEKRWYEEATARYPLMFREEAGIMSALYLRCELDTYSPAVLESYLKDIKEDSLAGKNRTIETYSIIAVKLGYNSLEEWNQQMEVTG